MKALNIVLVNPEIPQNTGNISRTCAATNCSLYLVRPLGFEITDKHLKRAGLDYWQYLDLHYLDSIDELFEKYYNGNNFIYCHYFFPPKEEIAWSINSKWSLLS